MDNDKLKILKKYFNLILRIDKYRFEYILDNNRYFEYLRIDNDIAFDEMMSFIRNIRDEKINKIIN